MAAANFLTKAMALPAPPPAPQLARKGDWSEMNHSRNAASLHIPTPRALAPLHAAAKNSKRACGATTFGLFPPDLDLDAPPRCPPNPALDSLSDEARRFLEEDPFDFDALPHPVLMRQQAVCVGSAYGNSSEVDDDDAPLDDRTAAAPEACSNPRWNASVVGTSLSHAGRGWNVPLVTRSDGVLR